MEYNDFELLDNYEAMAKEYFVQMQNKGYMFVKVKVDNNKDDLVKEVVDIYNQVLGGYNAVKRYLKKTDLSFFEKVYFLTVTQLDKIKSLYNLSFESQSIKAQNAKMIISKEACLLEKLFLLMLEDEKNFEVIKDMIMARLKILQED